jgi:hypothetical protein
MRLNVPRPGSEDKPFPIGWELATQDLTLADAKRPAARGHSSPDPAKRVDMLNYLG